MRSSSGISYEAGGAELLPRVRPLWERIRAHHEGLSIHFCDLFANATFTHRSRELLRKGKQNGLKIFIACEKKLDQDIGYCICTLDPLKIAEVDSLFVDRAYRGKRIGDALLTRALKWIQSRKPTSVNIFVAVGNERALKFYKRFRFLPYTILLKQRKVKAWRSPRH